MCSCKKISGMTHETLKWKLFPFSLSGEAKQWYIRVVGCVNGSWIELRDIFCSAFFLLSRICAQNDKESIGVAWARFTLLEKSGPNLSLPEHLLLQHFYAGSSSVSVWPSRVCIRDCQTMLSLNKGGNNLMGVRAIGLS